VRELSDPLDVTLSIAVQLTGVRGKANTFFASNDWQNGESLFHCIEGTDLSLAHNFPPSPSKTVILAQWVVKKTS